MNILLESEIKKLLELMVVLTDKERKEVFLELTEKYCEDCGREQPKSGRSCQCWNDD